jgi:phage virion morphogenesis protein
VDDDLSRFEEWFGQILAGLAPEQRKSAAMKLGRELRRSNLQRIGQNVEPDGNPMEPRKPRKDRRGRVQRRGKMFKGLRRLRNWKVSADAEGLEITPATGAVDRVAAVSQFSEVALVGYLRNGTPIRARYAQRRVLGFSPEDRLLAIDVASRLLDPAD